MDMVKYKHGLKLPFINQLLIRTKSICILVVCFVMVQCASTNQSKPYVEAIEQEFSFDHINGLPKGKDLKTLVKSPGFKLPQMIGGKESLRRAVAKLTDQIPCPVRGRVSVVYVVDEKGRVIDPQTALGIHDICDSTAIKAISQVSFKPAVKNGKPIKLQMSNAMVFQ